MNSSRLEMHRKAWHMAGGIVATPLLLYTGLEYATLVAVAAIVFVFAVELLSLLYGIHLPFWADQLKRTRRPGEGFSWASVGFLATIVTLGWLVPEPLALAAAGLLAFGDGLSALVGRAVGRVRIPWNPKKTWEGTLAGFAGGLLGASLLFLWWQHERPGMHVPIDGAIAVLAVGAAAAMAAESLPRIQDNVTVPAASGLAMFLVWNALGYDPAVGPAFDMLGL